MNKHIGIAMGAFLVLAVQHPVWADMTGTNGGNETLMERADTNHDGKISMDEFKAAHEKRVEEMFKRMDTNGDGFIDKDEMRKHREMMREKMREHMHQGMGNGTQSSK